MHKSYHSARDAKLAQISSRRVLLCKRVHYGKQYNTKPHIEGIMHLKWTRRAILAIAVGFGMMPSACMAAANEPIAPDRPDFSEGVDTVPVGMTQLEMGYTYSRSGAESDQSLGNFLVRVPINTRCEARIGLNSYDISRLPGGNTSGFEDLDIGVKYKLNDKAGKVGSINPNTSIILLTSLPTGGTPYRTPSLQPTVKLCAGWSLTENIDLSGNLNYSNLYDPAGRYSQWAVSTSFGFTISPRWGSFLEYYGSFPGTRGGPNANFVDTGLSYLINDNLAADVQIGKGINGIPNEFFWGTGLSVRW